MKKKFKKSARSSSLPESTSTRVNTMCADILASPSPSLKDLRFVRDLAARDGDMRLSLACATAIDKARGLY